MSNAHRFLKINFEEFFIIKILIYETCMWDLRIYVNSFILILSGIERSRYEIAVSVHFDMLSEDLAYIRRISEKLLFLL
jgi:hypothetical protein